MAERAPLGAPEVPRYRPLTRRRRLLIFGLAVATALCVGALLLDPPGGVQRKRLRPAPPAACAEGQTSNCVGGKVEVIVPRTAAAASR